VVTAGCCCATVAGTGAVNVALLSNDGAWVTGSETIGVVVPKEESEVMPVDSSDELPELLQAKRKQETMVIADRIFLIEFFFEAQIYNNMKQWVDNSHTFRINKQS